MPPRTPYKLAIDRIQTTPTHGLTALPTARIDAIKARPVRVAKGQQYHIQVHTFLAEMAHITNSTSVLERMGATLLLNSFIEGRIRAMYRDRHAIMHDLPRPSAAAEAREFSEASDAGVILRSTSLDKDPVYRQLCQLRYYEDIDEHTFKELKLFTDVRNAMVHDAMYRLDAFSADIIHAQLPLVDHLTKMRQKVRNRTEKERDLHEIHPHRSDYFAAMKTGTRIKRVALFTHVAGSPSSTINAPMSFAKPLYVIAMGVSGPPRVKFEKEELSTHELWNSFVNTTATFPILRKVQVNNGSEPEVEYLGYGRLVTRGQASASVHLCDVVLV